MLNRKFLFDEKVLSKLVLTVVAVWMISLTQQKLHVWLLIRFSVQVIIILDLALARDLHPMENLK